ncbi:TRAP transporter substrate-binding protein [Hirschia maritima]|uniref:TRAP transporter substrate-binding protein n=1 Tax=Hirschia maritima TaxID=1121961 RepID=UPI000377811A|nr:TRAP transporter substrate-binding protein [Hirschia maritima]
MKNSVLASLSLIALTACNAETQTTAEEKIKPVVQSQKIEMTTVFGKNLPILGTAAVDFSNRINDISNEVEFEHYDPGKLVPALEALDAVSNGSVDASYAMSGYWQGKIKAASLFSAVPFGPEVGEYIGWILYDDGADLWQEMYDTHGYNVVAMPCGIIAPETSGWFRKEVNSVEDLKGLNMRFFGLGASVMQKLGVSTSLLGASDIFPALERGALDATEFSMPRIDARLGFHKIAKYNYFPGWHQPATISELLINKDIYAGLSDTAKEQIKSACLANLTTNFAEGEATNFQAMIDNQENNGVQIRKWSPELLETFEDTWYDIADEMASEDAFFKKVWDDLQAYRRDYYVWSTNIYMPRD